MRELARRVESALAGEHLACLPAAATPAAAFRRAAGASAALVVAEAPADLPTREDAAATPPGRASVRRPARRVGLVPVLRASPVTLDPAFALLPDEARVGFHGVVRDEETPPPRTYVRSLPADVPVAVAPLGTGLDEGGFLLPGLGEAGDRLYGVAPR